jgi:hypothetical protein
MAAAVADIGFGARLLDPEERSEEDEEVGAGACAGVASSWNWFWIKGCGCGVTDAAAAATLQPGARARPSCPVRILFLERDLRFWN